VTGSNRFDDAAFPIVVAHRGASSTHPENTLEAFEAAVALGAQVVELDVRLSSDGVPVVMHDPDVSRTTEGVGLVHEMRAEELTALRARGGSSRARVPTLRQALSLLSGRSGVAIEIKNLPGDPAYDPDHESIAEAALDEVSACSFEGPVLVVSFNPRSIAFARAAASEIVTGLLITDAVAPDDGLAHVVEHGHDLLLPGSRGLVATGARFVERAHGARVRVGTWTVDDADRFAMLLGWGVDAVATNDPAMGLAALARHRDGG
jgi:glycerophosphoryl diester phosphodiesterase